MNGKYYIYSQRFGSENINFTSFLFLLKRKISVFEYISAVKARTTQFKAKWETLQKAILLKLSHLRQLSL